MSDDKPTVRRNPNPPFVPPKGSWEEDNDAVKKDWEVDAIAIAMGTFCERLSDPNEDRSDSEHDHLLDLNAPRVERLADILGSSGDTNTRMAAALILRALDDPRVKVDELANRSGGIRIPKGFYAPTDPEETD